MSVAGTGHERGDHPSAAREFLSALSAARKSFLLYPSDHPALAHSIDDLRSTIDRLHARGHSVAIAFSDGDLVFEDRVLTHESVLFDQLMRDITALDIDTIEVLPGVSIQELSRALAVLSSSAADIAASGGTERIMEMARLDRVRIGRVKVSESSADWTEGSGNTREAYEGAIDIVRQLEDTIRSSAPIRRTAAIRTAVTELVQGVLNQRTSMLALTALRNYDEYTFYHSANVAILSLGLGSLLTRAPRFLSSLATGALLHDIGKLRIDKPILNKEGPLTPEEWESMRTHPVSGARIVSHTQRVDRSAAVIVLEHHMAFDGAGYPKRVPVKRQHVMSRIVAVADAYDAMTSRRSYSGARSPVDAMRRIVAQSGRAYDPALVRLFIEMLGVYPPRSVVRLSDGRSAVVVRPGDAEPLRPVVRVIAEGDGTLVDTSDLLDLAAVGTPAIARHIPPDGLNIDADDYL